MGGKRKESQSHEEDNKHYIPGIGKVIEKARISVGPADVAGHGRRHGIRRVCVPGELRGAQCDCVLRELFQHPDHVPGGKEPGGRV